MLELSEKKLLETMKESNQAFAIFFYTPLCGTCAITKRMLDIVAKTLPNVKLLQGNINFMPSITKDWKIESVPCLVLIEHKMITHKVYAMNSADYLYRLLKPLN